jgi:hypothetical protein
MVGGHDPTPRPSPEGSVGPLLKLEGAAVMLASGLAFQQLGGSWVWFAALFLVPDLFMVGYLKDRRVGAIVYNAAHTYLAPGVLLGLWLVAPEIELLRIAAIWTAHIGLDRMLGYGLKYRTAFKDTHLHRA